MPPKKIPFTQRRGFQVPMEILIKRILESDEDESEESDEDECEEKEPEEDEHKSEETESREDEHLSEEIKSEEDKPEFEDYDESVNIFDSTTNKLVEDTETQLLNKVLLLLGDLDKHVDSTEFNWSFSSVHNGTAGLALLYLRMNDIEVLGEKLNKDYLQRAFILIESKLPYLKEEKNSFIMGPAGPIAIASVIYHRLKMFEESQSLVRRLLELGEDIFSSNSDWTDDFFTGRAGFLYAILYVLKRREITFKFLNTGLEIMAHDIVKTLLKSGQYLAEKFKKYFEIPLLYEWNGNHYTGISHGFTGILYMLLQAKDYMTKEQFEELVKPSVEFVLNLQLKSGNFSPNLYHSKEGYIQWSQGAPGIIHLLLLAYEIFQEVKYLEASRKCSDFIWEKGLWTNQSGLCHGAPGNGYAHLRLFQVTHEEKYLYRALKFGEWCFTTGTCDFNTPINAYSLFEGYLGTIYFLVDLLDPLNSGFPAFHL